MGVHVMTEVPTPPDAAPPAYRWVVVGAGAAILAVAMGSIVNGFSAFLVPLETARGWDRAEVAAVNSFGILGLAVGGLLAGRLADRVGARPVVAAGCAVLGLGYLVAATARELWQLYAIFAVSGFAGAGAIFAPVLAVTGNWFRRGAGLAIGIVSAGQAAGQGGVPFLSAWLIEKAGPETTLAVNGLAILALIPLALLLAPPPPEPAPGRAAAGEPAAYLPTRRVVAMLSVAIVLCCTCMSTPLMHLVPLIQEVCGAPLPEASRVLFGMLLIAILGRIAFGRLADVIGALPAYMTATLWMTLLVYGFMMLGTLGGFTVYALLYGFGYAGVMTGVLVSIRELVAPARRAGALGTVTAFGWLGHAIGGYQGGWLYDATGSYHAAFGLAAGAGLINLVIVGALWRMTLGPRRLSPRPA